MRLPVAILAQIQLMPNSASLSPKPQISFVPAPRRHSIDYDRYASVRVLRQKGKSHTTGRRDVTRHRVWWLDPRYNFP